MKKLLSLLLAVLMSLTVLTACVSEDPAANIGNADLADWEYISDKGEMIIGITLFAPMNYKDADGELTGFETEFATAVCEKLGVTPVFQEIDWNSKETELNSKNIDCIWNGMTITDERKSTMGISTPYMENKQVGVTKLEKVEAFSASVDGAIVVAEAESAGEEVATTDAFFANASYTAVDSQAKTLLEVKSGTADIAVIDYVMSIGSIGEGTDYADLAVIESASFSPEQYGIAFRKGDTETLAKVNAAIAELMADGTLDEIAGKYKLDALLIK